MEKQNNFAFIDAQNLNLGISKDIRIKNSVVYKGWKLDMQKLYVYLREKYNVTKAYLFLGYIPENEHMYKKFSEYGYSLIFKKTIPDHTGKPKGNVDAELVLQAAAKDFWDYDRAVIITGDGDFACLIEFLQENNKLHKLLIPNEYIYSRLLRPVAKKKIAFVSRVRKKLEYK